MATATEVVKQVSGDKLTVINIDPGGLDHYLKMVGDQPGNPRIKCFGGSILFVSPGLRHERASGRLDTLIKSVVQVLRIPSRACASTLYRLRAKDEGFEPDRSYYVQN